MGHLQVAAKAAPAFAGQLMAAVFEGTNATAASAKDDPVNLIYLTFDTTVLGGGGARRRSC
jgi:hypothetical protein